MSTRKFGDSSSILYPKIGRFRDFSFVEQVGAVEPYGRMWSDFRGKQKTQNVRLKVMNKILYLHQ